MSRISQRFNELAANKEKAFIPFLTVGDPSLKKTLAYVKALIAGGADVIELGVPFSDPMADGPVIQEADERALAQGVTLNDVLTLVAKIRQFSEVPLLLMGYYNPIFHMGIETFARKAARAGVDGCLIVDLPPEESGEIKDAFAQHGIDIIHLLSPTSTPERIRQASQRGSGFLYYVSMRGITGAKLADYKTVARHVKQIKAQSKLPVAVGFGIGTPKAAREVTRFADAAVVGSAVVKKIAAGASAKEIETMAAGFKKGMK